MPSRKSERGQPTTNDRSEGKTVLHLAFYFTAFRTVKQWFPVVFQRSGAPEFRAADNGQQNYFQTEPFRNQNELQTTAFLHLSYTGKRGDFHAGNSIESK